MPLTNGISYCGIGRNKAKIPTLVGNPENIMNFLFFSLCILLGAGFGLLISRLLFKNKFVAEITQKQTELDILRENHQELNAKFDSINSSFDKTKQALVLQERNNEVLEEKLATRKAELTEMSKKLHLEFENIANKIIDANSEKLSKQNKNNLESVLKPLGENINQFKKKIEDVYFAESKERFSLGKEVEKLVKLNLQISEEANNLTNALKGNSKTQGDWGEMILENILEQSGLQKGREYFVQEFLKDESGGFVKNDMGRKMQPDIIVNYPDKRKIIIDSKVSLTAYVKYCQTTDNLEQKKELDRHIDSIRRHIDELSNKRYQDFELSLDFVFMFVPNEPAYILALQKDPNLFQYAYNKRIVLISPTNLIASLKIIVDLWKREYQNQNAIEIAKRGDSLYNKFVGFVENMTKIGENLEKTDKAYNSALNQLKSGRGNLIGQAEKLKNLGVGSDKTLPKSLTEDQNNLD